MRLADTGLEHPVGPLRCKGDLHGLANLLHLAESVALPATREDLLMQSSLQNSPCLKQSREL